MKQSTYKAVVFDLDGTAIDSKYNITALAQVYLDYFGKDPSQEDLELTYAMTAENCLRHLGVPEEEIPAFEKRWVDAIVRLSNTEARLYDGIWETMKALDERNILLGINTSRRTDEVEPLRGYIAEPFLDLCKVIVTCDKIEHPKPAPDSLLYFLNESGLKCTDVLFVGDTEYDSLCAQDSGCDFALATWGAFNPDNISATYRPLRPKDLLNIVGDYNRL